MSEPASNKNRQGLLAPILLPVGILAVIALCLFGFSRILLQLSPTGATLVALFTAAAVFTIVSVVASRERLTGAALFPMLGAIVGAALLIGGIGLFAAPKSEGEAGNVEAISVPIAAPPGASTKGFSTDQLSFKADTPTNLDFDNQDPSVPHNVVIFEGKDDKGTQVFAGELVTGPNKATYAVPALKAGAYFFHCEVHPTTMKGDITVSDTGGAGGGLAISASNLQFSTDLLEAPAGIPATLAFDNQDAGTPHNVAVFTDKEYADSVFSGEIINGPTTIDYQLPALDAGTYFFKCEVHPAMAGELVVGGAGGGGGAGLAASATPTQSAAATEPPSPPPGGASGGGGVTIALSAAGLQFSTDQIEGDADVANTIDLDNQDAGVPHNVAIFRDAGFTDNAFTGDLVTGPSSIEYSVPALPAGTYYFRCDVHPPMQGVYVVGGG